MNRIHQLVLRLVLRLIVVIVAAPTLLHRLCDLLQDAFTLLKQVLKLGLFRLLSLFIAVGDGRLLAWH